MAKTKKPSVFSRLADKALAWWNYCTAGVWKDSRHSFSVRAVKILNLSVNAFTDRGLQIKSMALTYSTVLSIVPAFALLLAIGRGFGLQDSIQNELYILFPSQHRVITTCLQFVDSYLKNASEGIFVGVGIIVLLWTIFSLLSGIEDAFNSIWDVRHQRSLFRKFTDYITICLMVPVLLICSSGLSIFMSTAVQDIVYFSFLTPVVNFFLELAPLFLSWLAFTISYWLIPNTRVSFRFAAFSGAVAAIAFYVVQWLFINGQIYVSKYNAIYGSFAFLPLLLVWLQISWLILLIGCVLTYSLQNVFTFNYLGQHQSVNIHTSQLTAVIIMAVVTQRFLNREKPLTKREFAVEYNLPIRVIGRIIDRLKDAGFLYAVDTKTDEPAIAPGREVKDMSVADVLRAFNTSGTDEPSPDFTNIYSHLIGIFDTKAEAAYKNFSNLKLADLPIPTPEQIQMLLNPVEETETAATQTAGKTN